MKTKLIILLVFFPVLCFSQKIKYEDIKFGKINESDIRRSSYEAYLSKDNILFKIGDMLEFSSPSTCNGVFLTIYKTDIFGNTYFVGPKSINIPVEIKKIKITGSKKTGYKVIFKTKSTFGRYLFNIEDAIEFSEIKTFEKTSSQALLELKRAKDKFDLGLINEKEYETIKLELSDYIR
jgi:hypothetical protein